MEMVVGMVAADLAQEGSLRVSGSSDCSRFLLVCMQRSSTACPSHPQRTRRR